MTNKKFYCILYIFLLLSFDLVESRNGRNSRRGQNREGQRGRKSEECQAYETASSVGDGVATASTAVGGVLCAATGWFTFGAGCAAGTAIAAAGAATSAASRIVNKARGCDSGDDGEEVDEGPSNDEILKLLKTKEKWDKEQDKKILDDVNRLGNANIALNQGILQDVNRFGNQNTALNQEILQDVNRLGNKNSAMNQEILQDVNRLGNKTIALNQEILQDLKLYGNENNRMNEEILENILKSHSQNKQYFQVLSANQKELLINLINQRKENFLQHMETVEWFEKLDQNQKVILLEIETVKSNQKEIFRRLSTIDTELDELGDEVQLNQILSLYGESNQNLDFICHSFMTIERDELGNIKHEYKKEEFLRDAEDLSRSMTAVIRMLTVGVDLRPKPLWEQEGFCERKYLDKFLTKLYVAFVVKNFELSLRQYEMSNGDAVEFKKDMEDIFIKFVDVCGPENAIEYAYKSLILATRESNSIQDHGKFVQQQLDEKYQESVWNAISIEKDYRKLISTNIYVDDDSLQSMEYENTFVVFWALGDRPASVQVTGKSVADTEIRARRSVTIIPSGSQILEELEEKYTRLSTLFSQQSSELSALSSKHSALSSKHTALSNKVSAIPKHIGFSCYRDSDTNPGWDGIVSYTGCTVNNDNMLSTSSGKVRIKKAGVYSLTFFADMKSNDNNYIYVYMKRQSGGSETTLATVYNYMSEGGNKRNEFDYDSSSMTVLADLKSGDEIYNYVYARGRSNLRSISNERWIVFSGFLIQ